MTRHFTEATTGYWQRIAEADELAQPGPPWRFGYPARLPDGRVLMLPIRQLANEPRHAVASLLVNHAALDVVDTLGTLLAHRLAPLSPELVIGLPTLGLALAPLVARALGHARYLPLGYSRKFWYDDALSAPVHSITSPVPGKRIYLDPNLRPLIEGRRLVLVDDAVSTGTTLRAAWELIESLGGEVVACGVAMLQGTQWANKLGTERAARVAGVFESPLLQAVPEGWVLRDEALPMLPACSPNSLP
ncbi:phosphoribosyltransferase [Variovorax sp. SRS16]|uniref:phosphoribosyltransferase n=1 Tax=Variovorax sp. SRS16 TaxID=282217 RepID=UPI0013172654|nr:phosphoribosyltransferase [Variovorax sp. SRS16]VTU28949.1 phosphoribosyltransferase [Variovorax sp. SRS16]